MGTEETSTKNWIWISWETHRRTRELCKEFNIALFEKDIPLPRFLRHPYLILWSFYIIVRFNPKILIVQNPSIVLAIEAVLLKTFFSYSLIIDSHNASLEPILKNEQGISRFWHTYVQKKANLSLVTNHHLAEGVKRVGGTPFILEDKVPTFEGNKKNKLRGQLNIACISTFAADEPILEIIQAVKILNKNWFVYMTGNNKKLPKDVSKDLPPNLILTGFLTDEDYICLLRSVEIILDLTTRENCLVCGAYEAVGLGKPAILSDKIAIKSFFSRGAIFTKNQPLDIKNAIIMAEKQLKHLEKETEILKDELGKTWNTKRDHLLNMLRTLH